MTEQYEFQNYYISSINEMLYCICQMQISPWDDRPS